MHADKQLYNTLHMHKHISYNLQEAITHHSLVLTQSRAPARRLPPAAAAYGRA